MQKKCLILIILLLIPTIAFAQFVTGQTYDVFLKKYAENMTFINQNTQRRLLPLTLTTPDFAESDGRSYYNIEGEILSANIYTSRGSDVIEYAQFILTAPSLMQYGDALHAEFVNAGYHCYALLMAMHSSDDVVTRYSLIQTIEDVFNEGTSTSLLQLGVYSLSCEKVENVATFTFTNTSLVSPTPSPEPETEPEIEYELPEENHG